MLEHPIGYRSAAVCAGVRDDSPDFTLVVSEAPATAAAIFTQSSFAGPCVVVGRESVADGRLQAVLVVSKNANVATGAQGFADVRELASETGRLLEITPNDVLVCATGIIGQPLPMDRLLAALPRLTASLAPNRLEDTAVAILTTDRGPKISSRRIGDCVLVGMVKGAGMIEPRMATLLSYFFTDARIAAVDLRAMLQRVADRSFNCLTIDADTSTSDTMAILANGRVGAVELDAFEAAFADLAVELAKEVARGAEGATKLIEVHVSGARSEEDARQVGRAIAGSVLVKTAVFGGDPNWGRITMAIGKSAVAGIAPERTTIAVGGVEAFRGEPLRGTADPDIARVLQSDVVPFRVDLGLGSCAATVWGCDLSYETVRSNAEYST
jgi:glutamate N-acetyltransferase/amino-acid N-acetyltransferase